MITNIQTAKYLSDRLLDINSQLNESVLEIKGKCSPEEFRRYRRCVGVLINSIFENMLEPIYQQHPTLKPNELEM